MSQLCPCQSGLLFTDCCEPFLTNKEKPDTAEALMRSRYTAYTRADWKYVFKTWHKSTRPTLPSLRSSGSAKWLVLKIVSCHKGKLSDVEGQVEFIASYKNGEEIAQIKEHSQFVREKGKWMYVDALS